MEVAIICGDGESIREGLLDSLVSSRIEVKIQATLRPSDVDCLPWAFNKNVTVPGLGRYMTVGEFLCSAQHQLAYKTIIDGMYDSALIVEDDCVIHDESLVRECVSAASTDLRPVVIVLHRLQYAAARYRGSPGGLLRVTARPTQTVCYVVNRAAAAELMVPAGQVLGLADWPAVNLRRIAWMVPVRAVDGSVASENLRPSEIDGLSGKRMNGSVPRFTVRPLLLSGGLETKAPSAAFWILACQLKRSILHRLSRILGGLVHV